MHIRILIILAAIYLALLIFDTPLVKEYQPPADWTSANPKNLINECAIRKKAIRYPNGGRDNSYTDEPVIIRDVSPDGHIMYIARFITSVSILPPLWNDDQWMKAPDYMCHGFNELMEWRGKGRAL